MPAIRKSNPIILQPQPQRRHSDTDKNRLLLTCISQATIILNNIAHNDSSRNNEKIQSVIKMILGLNNNHSSNEPPLIQSFKDNTMELIRNESLFKCAHKSVTRGSSLLLLKIYLHLNNLDETQINKNVVENFWCWLHNVIPKEEIDFSTAKNDIDKYLNNWLQNRTKGYFIQDVPDVMYANSPLSLFKKLFTHGRYNRFPHLVREINRDLSYNEQLQLIDKIYAEYIIGNKKILNTYSKRMFLLEVFSSLSENITTTIKPEAYSSDNLANSNLESDIKPNISSDHQRKMAQIFINEYIKNYNMGTSFSEIKAMFKLFATITDLKAQRDILLLARDNRFLKRCSTRNFRQTQQGISSIYFSLILKYADNDLKNLIVELLPNIEPSFSSKGITKLLNLIILCRKDLQLNQNCISEIVKSHLLLFLAKDTCANIPAALIDALFPSLNIIDKPWKIYGIYNQLLIVKAINSKKITNAKNFLLTLEEHYRITNINQLYREYAFQKLIMNYHPDSAENLLSEINKIEDKGLKSSLLEQLVRQLKRNIRYKVAPIILDIIFSDKCYLQNEYLESILIRKLLPSWINQNSEEVIIPSCLDPILLEYLFMSIEYLKKTDSAETSKEVNLFLLSNLNLINQLICISATSNTPDLKEQAIQLNRYLVSLPAIKPFFTALGHNFDPAKQVVFLSKIYKKGLAAKVKFQLNIRQEPKDLIIREAITISFEQLLDFFYYGETTTHGLNNNCFEDRANENLFYEKIELQKLSAKKLNAVINNENLAKSLVKLPLLYKQYSRYNQQSNYFKLVNLFGLPRELMNHLLNAFNYSTLNSEENPYPAILPFNYQEVFNHALIRKLNLITNQVADLAIEAYMAQLKDVELNEVFLADLYNTFNLANTCHEEQAKLLICVAAALIKLSEIFYIKTSNQPLFALRYLAIAALNSACKICPDNLKDICEHYLVLLEKNDCRIFTIMNPLSELRENYDNLGIISILC